ncbi:hypothetical protein HELRODRAFT_162931 [Helobdella robusta]|uniref:Uncharacterized protein n=1 Tax=Helobdella robusta TaxID=6412 RepID=T1ETD5_HELRO|nr:hypothetical protein HELRODRAFT_162931 [Helobdella robusta]ESN99384.1 hypothetical protein HELRODRAFT_162931 [Helobdella robusta]
MLVLMDRTGCAGADISVADEFSDDIEGSVDVFVNADVLFNDGVDFVRGGVGVAIVGTGDAVDDKSLVLVYLDDEDKFLIAPSLIGKKDANNKYCNMHLSYSSGHSTPSKPNRKIAFASSSNKIKKGPQRLTIAQGTETTET